MKICLYAKKVFGGINLKNKMLLSYIVFFLLPICIFSVLTFNSVSNTIEENLIFSVEKNYNQTFSYLSEKLNKIKKTSEMVLINEDVNNLFVSNDFYSDANNYFATKKAMDFLASLEDDDISKIVLYLYNYSEDKNRDTSYFFSSVRNIEESDWYTIINKSNQNILWCPREYLYSGIPENVKPNSESLALIRRFYNPSNFSLTLGYYCIYFNFESIKDIVNMGDSINGSVTFLHNSEKDLIYSSNQSIYDDLSESFFNKSQVELSTSLLNAYKTGNNRIIFAEKQFDNSDWSLVTLIPYDDILSQIKNTQGRIAIFTVVISILCFSFAWMLAISITKRIKALENRMKKVQKGNISLEKSSVYTDEIGYLENTYEFMIDEIQKLMEERFITGTQVKAAELRALQEQINPHFLYNTLDTINWLAQKGNTQEVEKAISSLAEFYRLSLSNGNDEIPLSEELNRISTYVQIQNIRFSGGIKLIIDIDDSISECLILKLILQPFVENSILHGIMGKPSKEGVIIIESIIEEDTIVITIQDNGIGMSEETLDKLNKAKSSENYLGYGIKNVRERIRLNYGDQYKIQYTSSSSGTKVVITIPLKYFDTKNIYGSGANIYYV